MIHKRRALTLGLAAMVLGLLYAGLQPFGFSPPNLARPPSSGPGLTFKAPSMAISEAAIEWEGDAASAEISMHIWIEPGVPSRVASGALLSLVDGSERPSFLVAQWKGGLNLRVRSDNRRGYWEIGAPGVLEVGRRHLVTITSGAEKGTRVFIDGEMRARSSRTVQVPAGEQLGGRLLLGCESDGAAGWAGTVFGLAIQGEAITSEVARELDQTIRREGFTALAGAPSLRALYLFAPAFERRVPDAHTPSEAGPVLVPEIFEPMRYAVLTVPSWDDMKERWFLIDLPRNIAGFIPFGILVGLLLYRPSEQPGERSGRRPGRRGVGATAALTLLLGVGLSLAIESVQVFLPDRNSSLLDLLGNALGTGVGLGIALQIERRGLLSSEPGERDEA